MVLFNKLDDGRDRAWFMKKRQFNDLDLLKQVLMNLSKAVLYLHQNGITHDDINLSTIRLSEGKYKLCFHQVKEVKKYMVMVNKSSEIQ